MRDPHIHNGRQGDGLRTYDVELSMRTFGDAPFVVPALEILARPLFNLSIDGMLGRDVPGRLVLTIDGPRQRYRIEY